MRYRRVSPRFWNDAAVRRLTPEHKLLALYLISGPPTNRIGLYVLSLGVIAEDLVLTIDAAGMSLDHVCKTLGWQYDWESRVIFIPTWFRYNDPRNRNMLTGLVKDIDDLPETPLINAFASNAAYLWGPCKAALHTLCRERRPDCVTEHPIGSGPNTRSVADQTASRSDTTPKPTPSSDANPGTGTGTGAGTGAGDLHPVGDTDAGEDDTTAPDTSTPPTMPDVTDADATALAWVETGIWTLQSKRDAKAHAHVTTALIGLVRDFGDAQVAAWSRDMARWLDANPTRARRKKRLDRMLLTWAKTESERARARGEDLSVAKPAAPPDPKTAKGVEKLEREFGR